MYKVGKKLEHFTSSLTPVYGVVKALMFSSLSVLHFTTLNYKLSGFF